VILEPPAVIPDVADLGRVHLVGIGGGGMSGIARILSARGVEVTGSDAKPSATLTGLLAVGVRCYVGHATEHVGNADTVVVSSAIKPDNPEVAEARRRGLLVLPRAVALAALMQGYRTVAVAGTHGKTTTTSMVTVALQHCGLDPCFAIGGNLAGSGANAHHGSGDVFVAETDESDGSLVAFRPHVAVVTNVDYDHVDQHGDAASYAAVFERFASRIPPEGTLVVCLDDPGADALGQQVRASGARVRTYGRRSDADVRVERVDPRGLGTRVRLLVDGRRLHDLELSVPGAHNALNAAAALSAGLELGVPRLDVMEGLASFPGTLRRFEFKGQAAGVRVFDDYAHHPTELLATLETARQVAGSGRVVVVFQPHLYSRTQAFAEEFGQALGRADRVIVMDVFAAREDPVLGVSGALIADAVPSSARFVASWSQVPAAATALVEPGDLLLTVGAGDVTLIGPEVLELLRARESA